MTASDENNRIFDFLDQSTHLEGDRLVGEFQGLRLFSHFQSVFSLAHQRQVGVEAIFSGIDPGKPDEGPLTSFNVFSRIPPETVIQMDQLRQYQHFKNFKDANMKERWLFINLHPKILMSHGGQDIDNLGAILERVGLKPHQVVVALREHAEVGSDKIVRTMEGLRKLGTLIAFDDYSSGIANLDRLWTLRPDIVKLKRSFIENAMQHPQAMRMLNKLVSLIHASGCLVLMEKIESADEAIVAMETSADFVQGHFFGGAHPRPMRKDVRFSSGFFADLAERHERALSRQTRNLKGDLSDLTNDFMDCAWGIGDGQSLEDAGQAILQRARTERLYLLNEHGVQVGQHIYGHHQSAHNDPRHLPLEDSVGSTWTRRSIFTDAIRHPSIVQSSAPFRSISSLNTSITLSVSVRIGGKLHVLCCDVRWDEGVVESS
ncbi:MAG: EAL domain-containing protein [Magnetococcales bacterium]|nr:EAL domain-containing protein [Magnetococcales bacterium]